VRENRVDIGLLDLLPRGFRGLNIGFLEVVPKKAAEERAFPTKKCDKTIQKQGDNFHVRDVDSGPPFVTPVCPLKTTR